MGSGSTPEVELTHHSDAIIDKKKRILYNVQCIDTQLHQSTASLHSIDNSCTRCRQNSEKGFTQNVDFLLNASKRLIYTFYKKSYKYYKQQRLKNKIQLSSTSIYENSKGHLLPKKCEPPFRRKNTPTFSRRILQGTMKLHFVFLLFYIVYLFVPFCRAEFTDDQLAHFRRERAEAAEKWAPMVFLHPDERYFSSDVHSFLQNVIPRKIPDSERTTDPPVVVSLSRSLDIYSLPEGVEGEDTYLIAPIDENCKNCPLPNFLHGTKPSAEYSPPIYAVITSCLPSKTEYVRSPRNTDVSSNQPRRRKFRLKRRRRKLSFKDRLKLFRRRRTSLPSDWDPYTDTEPLNSFTSLEEYETLKEGESSKQTIKNYSPMDLKVDEDLEDPVVKPPSTTLQPPRQRLDTTIQPEPEIDAETTIQYGDTTVVDIVLDTSSIRSINLSDDTSSESQDNYLDNNSTSTTTMSTRTNTSLDQETNASISKEKEVDKKPQSSNSENESQENDIPEGNVQINTSHRFTVTYWMFYPYSQGKQVCTSRLWILGRVFKPRLRNKCYGDLITLNSHVGDWEHVSIYFEDDLPTRMYVSTHTYGAYYIYQANENIFVYRGKDTRLGLPLNPKYPPVIKMDGTHPVLYAALGSHGLWGSPGVHRYENLVPLEDKTTAGTPWKSWKNIDIIDYRDPDHLRPDRQWLKFYGRWGNPSNGCHRALFGTCDLASGPTGIPLKRENFPCHLPDHPTFFPEI